jgi:hypothetical protein
MVVIVLGLRTAGLTLNSLTTSLERLCSKEDRTWKERIFNDTKLVRKCFFYLLLIDKYMNNNNRRKKNIS